MQLFRREKSQEDLAQAGKNQAASSANWYERAGPETQSITPQLTQDEEVLQQQAKPPVTSPTPPNPMAIPSSELNEETRSVPSMSNIARENLPYPDLPVQGGSRQAQATGQATVIDAQSHFNGNYRSDSDLIIEGTFEGEIECNGTVTVAKDATMSATVRARNVVVAGSANGEITCDERFSVSATGEMRGKAQAATLVVEEGAFFEGEFRMGSSYSSSSPSSSYGDWESARSTPEESRVEYSMSVDESDLEELDAEEETESFSVDEVWDDGDKAEEG